MVPIIASELRSLPVGAPDFLFVTFFSILG
jgi:hypothetical protein